jgi:SAM-dependent methyltransferase
MTTSSIINDIIEWDVTNWEVALDYWSNKTNLNISSVYALEIGSRNGGLSLWMALNGAKVLCTDLDGPTDKAIVKHNKYGVSHLIKYKSLDALNISYNNEFDVVLFKSVLGGIGRFGNDGFQYKAIREMYKSLRKGGELWFAENLVASPLHKLFRRKFVKWGNEWRYVSINEMNKMLEIFSKVDFITAGFLGNFGRNSTQRMILGKLDRYFVDKLVPKEWQYIIIGVARK